ncbi:hypothetical protein [Inhella sp.]|uniref:hypothetical protein n=1 Tax=Inhella sp. TaxID=1921806 RepID=UPI0035AF226C
MHESEPDDPLWTRKPLRLALLRGSFFLLPVLLVAGLGRLTSGSWWGALGGALVAGAVVIAASGLIERALGRLGAALRHGHWRDREGRHFSVAGVSLQVHDDGRQIWLHETGVRRLLGLRDDPPDAFKARFSRHWRHAAELGLNGKGLWLDAADVHRYLGQAPNRMDPVRLRLRTYLDRELLQPAARRRSR